MHGQSGVTTYLFTDIEGSTRLWEEQPEKMRAALARHDALTRQAVESHRGVVVKTTGDGFHAVFHDPLDALAATVQLNVALREPESTAGVAIRIRSALHAGVDERGDNDFYGPVVNRAARIMGAAHGGQILVSQAIVALIACRLPDGVALRELGRVRLRDLASAETVYQVVHPELRQEFPALRSLEETPHNLPQQVTSFVGREQDLAEVKRLLATTRLLTLVGTGGLGKTRLSLQAAADVLDEYPDGVWFVELAAITDASRVSQAVATVFGVKEEPGHPVIDSLLTFVSNRNLLLILDNCEHLVQACADLCKRLLQSGTNLRILASSREALRTSGEVTYPLRPLTVPDPAKRVTHSALDQYEAARLFVTRVVAVQPAFAVDDLNAPAVAEICHRLDGIPLALELAAARARSLPVDVIAARLNDRFRLLSRGDQTALPRQQTLRALIDWSHDLLGDHERVLFRRLAAFAGGWTLDAAEAICCDAPLGEDDVLDLLTMLVEKSLVTVDARSGRYRFLDTISHYARDRLEESGEAARLRTRHLDHYLALTDRARAEFNGANQSEWLARFDLESENISAAHAWCGHADGGAEKDLRLVYGARTYWFRRGMLEQGLRFTLEALARTRVSERSPERSRALFHAGQFGYFMGDYAEAQRHLEESLAIARELDDKGRIAAVLQPLGSAVLAQGDVPTAQRHLEEGVAIAKTLGSKESLAAALNALAQLHRLKGDLDIARRHYEQVVAIGRELGDRSTLAIGMLNLAMVDVVFDANQGTRQLLAQALAIAREISSKQIGQSALEICAALAATLHEWVLSAQFFGAAEAIARHTGLRRDPTDEAFLIPFIERTRSTLGSESFNTATRRGQAFDYDQAITAANDWLRATP